MRVHMIRWLIATTLAGAACHTMKPVPLEALGGVRPARVWVTRADQAVVVVDGPQMFGDTLVGYVNGRFEELPAADVRRLVMRAPARGRTAALVAGGALGLAAVVYLVSGGGGSRDPCTLQSSECDPNAP